MKARIITILFFGIATFLGAQVPKELTIPLSNPGKSGKLDVEIKFGSIKVTGTNRTDVLIKYQEIEKEDEDKEDDEQHEGLKKISSGNFNLEIGEEDNEVYIHSETWFKGVDLEIEVPEKFDLELDGYMSSMVHVEKVNGELSLESYTGSIEAKNVSGAVNASTYAGSIHVSFDQVDPGKAMAFSTYAGNIDLTLPSNYKADFKMKTSWGDIYSAFDMVMKVPEKPTLKKDDETDSFRMITDSWTYGSLNGGGPEVMIKNFSGSIYLRKK